MKPLQELRVFIGDTYIGNIIGNVVAFPNIGDSIRFEGVKFKILERTFEYTSDSRTICEVMAVRKTTQ